MKSITALILFLVTFGYASSQGNSKCENHPLFSQMPQHPVNRCNEEEFNEITLYELAKDGSKSQFKKGGEFLEATYLFTGDWDKRPSAIQIFQNYINAATSKGGKVLFKSSSEVHLSLKKSGDQYWIIVSTDGSGMYSVTTIKEATMKQDIVVTADQIKSSISQEGKAVFYGIYFDIGKSSLKAESGSTITEMAKYLNVNATVKIYVVGHTDNTGSYENNLKLSLERAQAVVNELVLKHAIAKDRLRAAGAGPIAPATSNETDDGKTKNRRVEMVLM
jgi:outer membrane protein OmpA-like peptidoglycan-associated protein